MLWGTCERCQEGKVCGLFQQGLEGLWTQVLRVWAIHGHAAVHLFLSGPEQGVISAHISTTHSTETGEKPSSSLGLALAPSWQRPLKTGNAHGCWGGPGKDGGPRGALRGPAEPWADKLLQALHEHLSMLWALPQCWAGMALSRLAALQPCVPLSCRAGLDLPVPDMRRHGALGTEML